jgi:Zn-dependent M28 family amino/carboxypeptidase
VVTVSEQAAAAMLAASGKDIAGIKAAIDRDLKPVAMALAGVEAEIRVVLTESRRTRTVNVVGMIEGSDPKLKDETILLGAHWDHVGVAADGSVYTGADDNASGTAALVETARALAESGAKPRRSIVFAAFAAEERGLLGSSYYAARPPRPLETTRAMINMDMVGRNETPIPSTKSLFEFAADSSNELNIVGTFYSPDLRAAIERANRGAGLDLNYKWDQESSQSIFSRSDQFPFAALGVPAVFFFSGLHPDYHQTRDTPDLINYGKMTKVVKLAVATALDVAGAAAPPRFSEKR